MQLDRFSHSRDLMLRNDPVEALKSRDASVSALARRLQACRHQGFTQPQCLRYPIP